MLSGQVFSHYRILGKIGQGGLGEVFLAEDTILNRKVALKFLTGESAKRADLRARILIEAKSAASIDHPFVCKVYETGEVDGRSFIALEFIDGQTLADRLKAGSMPFEEGLTAATQVAEGIAAAHEREIVHRDVKPANIMIGRTGHVKVMDFGLAKQLTHAPEDDVTTPYVFETVEGAIVGTPGYMSPEQIRGERADARSDVFSLGLVYFQMFSGIHPFLKRTTEATVGAILHEPTPVLKATAPHVPVEISEIVGRMLIKEASGRYSSASEVRDDLLRFRHSIPITAKPSTQQAIAILPFLDLSPERDQEYFCDGLAEELITELGNLEGLRVASRTSSFRFRGREVDIQEVGDRLKVDAVLEGSVRKAGDRIRIIVKLVSVESGYPLWSERYDRQIHDIFEIQDEISQSIVDKMKVARPTVIAPKFAAAVRGNVRAYEQYLKGRYYWNKRTEENFKRSVDHFQLALQEDPNYVLAFAGIAEAYVTLALYGGLPPMEIMPRAKAAAKEALAREPELPEALTAMGSIQALYDWDWAAAEQSFKRAIKANPNYAIAYHWYAIHCLTPTRRFAEARAAIQRAWELEPLSLVILTTWGLVLYFEGEYDAAIQKYKNALELDPNFGIAHYFLGHLFLQKKMFKEAIASLERTVEFTNHSPESVAVLGYAHAISGDHAKAFKFADELAAQAATRYVSPALPAWIHLGLGDHEKALAQLELACSERATDLIWLRVRPVFDDLRLDPRYQSLCSRLGL